MKLLALVLQQANLRFISAKAHHTRDGMQIEEIVAPTPEDAAHIEAWAIREGVAAPVRVATPEEMTAFWARGDGDW
jgi:hypothetical protein